ncbi:MAG: gliding motility-associated C-terminal domain-containing protein [Chryseolinea sp.]
MARSLRSSGLILITIVLGFKPGFAQESVWGKFFDSKYGSVTMEACAEENGDVVLFGYYNDELVVGSYTFVARDRGTSSCIIRLNSSGGVVNAINIDGLQVYVENARIDSNGDYVTAGRFLGSIVFDGVEYLNETSPTSETAFVAKYSPTGNPIWIKTFSGTTYTNLAVDNNDYIYALSTEMMNYYPSSSTLRKYSSDGQLVFQNQYVDGSAQSYSRCIDVRNGEVIIGGSVYGSGTIFNSLTYSGTGYGFYIARFNTDGTLKWAKNLGTTNYNNADISDIHFNTNDDTFFIAGGLPDNTLLAKFGGNGTLMWSKKSLPQSFAQGYVQIATDGSILFTANFFDKAEIDGVVLNATPDSHLVKNAPNVGLFKMDVDGIVTGYQQFDPYVINSVLSVSINSYDEVFISGFSDAPAIRVGVVNITSLNDTKENNGDGYVVKFNGSTQVTPRCQIQTTEVCVSELMTFTTNFEGSKIKNIQWIFGDPSTGAQNLSTLATPSHTYSSPGFYKVKTVITDLNDNQIPASLIFEIHEPPTVFLGDDFQLCVGQTKQLGAVTNETVNYLWQDGSTESHLDITGPGSYSVIVTNKHCSNSDVVNITGASLPIVNVENKTLCSGDFYKVDLTNVNGSILWDDGNTSTVRNISEADIYTVTAANECGSASDNFIVTVIGKLTIDVDDTTICRGETHRVDLSDVEAAITWNTGETNDIKEFSDRGTYSVQATNSCETTSTTFSVEVIEPFDFSLGNDRSMCDRSKPIAIHAPKLNSTYRWSDGSTSDVIIVTRPGTYWLEITDACMTARDTIEVISASPKDLNVPNIITPNGDSKNDYFILDAGISGSSLLVYSRWGQKVYESDTYNNDWNGENLENTVYFYVVPEFCIKGWIQVMR